MKIKKLWLFYLSRKQTNAAIIDILNSFDLLFFLFYSSVVCLCPFSSFSSFSPEPLGQFQPNLAQNILGWREFKALLFNVWYNYSCAQIRDWFELVSQVKDVDHELLVIWIYNVLNMLTAVVAQWVRAECLVFKSQPQQT